MRKSLQRTGQDRFAGASLAIIAALLMGDAAYAETASGGFTSNAGTLAPAPAATVTTSDTGISGVLVASAEQPGATFTAAPAAAPAATPQAAAHSATLGEVVVTARRRNENLENVPIAITALSRSDLAQKSIQDTTDLQIAVPGLTIRETGNANEQNYSIRGQSVDAFTGSPPGVLPYIDEVQVVSKSDTVFYDLGGVQVLKGPQGTLFGRNTTGGAVLFDTAKPTDVFGGYIDGRYESYSATHVEGALNLPINDKVLLRVAGSYSAGGAYVENLLTNQRLGDLGQNSARATLVLKPTSQLTNTTVAQYTKDYGTNAPTVLYSTYGCGATKNGVPLVSSAACAYSPVNPAFAPYIAAHPQLYQGGILAYQQLQNQLGPYKVEDNYPDPHRAESEFVINTTAYEINEHLTVKNILGFNSSITSDGFDVDGSPYPIGQTGGTPNTSGIGVSGFSPTTFGAKQASEEFQLQGKEFGQRLVYSVGGYYSYENDVNYQHNYFFDFSPLAPGETVYYSFRTIDRSKAVYGQATYQVLDNLSLTGGVRYTWEDVDANQLPGSIFGESHPQHVSFSDPSWTVSLDYKVQPGWLLYVATRGSFRAGGFNSTAPPTTATAESGGNLFNAETTHDVEVGSKISRRLYDLPFVFNIDAYNQWVDNVQRAGYVVLDGAPAALTVNVPSAEVSGVEADGSVQPVPWLALGGSVAYTDARYTDGNVVLFNTAQSFGPYADTPRWSGTIYAEGSYRLAGGLGKLILHSDIYAQAAQFFSNLNNTASPDTRLPSYGLANARLSWQDVAGSHVTAAIFVKNLTDKVYYNGGFPTGADLGLNDADAGRPRFVGGELRYDF